MYKFGFLLFVLLIFWGCSSQVAFTTKKAANVDSVLFYQSQDLPDPFIDTILSQPGDSATLTATLFPPPPTIQDSLRQVDGFRVQVFAGLDSMRAETMKSQVSELLPDTIYILKENGLYKIQVGDFLYRNVADSVQRQLTINSISGTWVVAKKIYPGGELSTTDIEVVKPIVEDYKFKIQIVVTSDEARAMALVQSIQQQFALPAFYIQSDNLYKVFLGKFRSREEANPVLQQVRQEAYPDAWLVY